MTAITVTNPIPVSIAGITYDKISVTSVVAVPGISGGVHCEVIFNLCRLDEGGNVVVAPTHGKKFVVSDLMIDPQMNAACQMFMGKLIASAFAAGTFN